MKKLKQLFCEHAYVFFPAEDIYLSEGDQYYGRASRLYRGKCYKCGKPVEVVKRWTLLQQEGDMKL